MQSRKGYECQAGLGSRKIAMFNVHITTRKVRLRFGVKGCVAVQQYITSHPEKIRKVSRQISVVGIIGIVHAI